tara:strand:+ start:507 stop:800 length:294 start_codon:yes stop_codon:yes gene_type:complete
MPRYKLVDGVRLQFTPEEEHATDLEEQKWNEGAFDRSMANLRSDRTNKLLATDWHGLSDVTMSAGMRQYRKELRDLPSGLTTVDQVKAVVWPTQPES